MESTFRRRAIVFHVGDRRKGMFSRLRATRDLESFVLLSRELTRFYTSAAWTRKTGRYIRLATASIRFFRVEFPPKGVEMEEEEVEEER